MSLKKHTFIALGLFFCLCMPSKADVSVLVAVEPTLRAGGIPLSRAGLEESLSKALAQNVTVTVTDDLTEAIRSTRSSGFDVFIAPAQIAASAINHGYTLVGSTDPEQQYLLVGKVGLTNVGQLRAGRLYLPQQDSIYTYLARGMLTANGLSFKNLSKVDYAHYPQAGLTAISMHSSDATVVQLSDWEQWRKKNVDVATVLATSEAVPGGFSVTVKKDMQPKVKDRLVQWFGNASTTSGLKPLLQRADLQQYKRLAELGTFTPPALPGVTLVDAQEIRGLAAHGAVIIDTRTEKEFTQNHIPGAQFVPYHEKSLKDISYDASLDDFSGVKALNTKVPTIFYCNGAECWKSYKASRAAIAAGFSKVYWYRLGLPDWEAQSQKTSELTQLAH